jgi:hypothetical protein
VIEHAQVRVQVDVVEQPSQRYDSRCGCGRQDGKASSALFLDKFTRFDPSASTTKTSALFSHPSEVKVICLPSGDHVGGQWSFPGMWVKRVTSEPSAFIT